jgi:hypothetical protein
MNQMFSMNYDSILVIPAKAGIQGRQERQRSPWTPAFAGVTITY